MARSRFVALVSVLLLSACSDGTEEPGRATRAGSPGFETSVVVDCVGATGRSSKSSSYLSGAPAVAADGTEFELRLRVLDGACAPVADVLVEIWHTGDSTEYSVDRWRTALRTDSLGAVLYETVRPMPGEGASHFHVRVDVPGFVTREWVLLPRQEAFLDVPLLLVHESTGPSPDGV